MSGKYKCKPSDLLYKQQMEPAPNESQILEDYINERELYEDEERVAKKAYLKESILNVYINEEEQIDRFLDFFLLYLRKKGINTQEHNLDLLSMDELKELVAEFRALHPFKGVIEVQNSLDVAMSIIEPIPHKEHFDAQRVYYVHEESTQSNGSWDYELEGYEQCKRLKPFFPLEDGCRNVVVIFEKQEVRKTGGFFGIGGRLDLWIEMRSNLLKENTTRRIQDFLQLRGWLTKCYPYVFIYPLEINQKQLERVGEEAVRSQLVGECRRFINFVCKNEKLLQSFYTHRFFKEKDYQAFCATRKEENSNFIKHLQNTEGCVPIEISDRNELLKKDSYKKAEELEKLWGRLDDFNARIAGRLKDVQSQIEKERKEIQRIILEFTNVNPLIKSKLYESVISTLLGYGELFKNCEENLGNLHLLFQSINLQVATQAKKTWGHFKRYAKDIAEVSEEYHARRKVFLEKEAQRLEQEKAKTGEGVITGENEPQLDPVNRSIINSLGVSSNSIKETAWIQRYSKWQGYINHQFVSSFERELQLDLTTLKKILQQNIVHRQETQHREEILIKSLQAAA